MEDNCRRDYSLKREVKRTNKRSNCIVSIFFFFFSEGPALSNSVCLLICYRYSLIIGNPISVDFRVTAWANCCSLICVVQGHPRLRRNRKKKESFWCSYTESSDARKNWPQYGDWVAPSLNRIVKYRPSMYGVKEMGRKYVCLFLFKIFVRTFS